MIPSLHRYLAVVKLSAEAAKPAQGLNAAKPAKLAPINKVKLPEAPFTSEGSLTHLNTKLSGAADALLKALPLVGEDAIELLARNVLKGGATAAAVPAGYEKARAEFDPGYNPNQMAINTRRILNGLSKIGTAGASDVAPQATPDNQSNFFYPYVPQKPWNEIDTKNQVEAAIDQNFGARFPFREPNMGDSAPPNYPKIAGDGNTQNIQEDRGGASNHISQMHSHLSDQLAGNSMMTEDAVSQAWDRLRAFMKDSNPPMNMSNDLEGAGQPSA